MREHLLCSNNGFELGENKFNQERKKNVRLPIDKLRALGASFEFSFQCSDLSECSSCLMSRLFPERKNDFCYLLERI